MDLLDLRRHGFHSTSLAIRPMTPDSNEPWSWLKCVDRMSHRNFEKCSGKKGELFV